ncbi:hypothetical protein CAPI_04900 [Corynebacterium capitovis DSM 44611]|uniref:DUF3710 domain-containing protein n=1 Tax=Corynebacterium capitovis TaxID=131081 RepID=UPI00037F74D1|nr:DUF3710 domain-containing protein [Corynebacterium capitovis]WKD57538.1 hypothetical protein CAPI_04900 [Corynebacterium capitovis DSM 44611]
MAKWPFSKKKEAAHPVGERGEAGSAVEAAGGRVIDTDTAGAPHDAQPSDPVVIPHDPVSGESGPFDGDAVDFEEFDFSDFSQVVLDLGSMKIPLPTDSQVQVEMGEAGPKMVHIVTRHGRATPVAFASPRTGGLWEESSTEIAEGMRNEGMPVSFETGPWGREVVGTGTNGVIRIIGVEGPRWLYRVTLAAPSGSEAALAEIGRQIVARSFVYRGSEPILAGNSLPVVLPQQLAAQVQQAVAQRNAQVQQNSGAGQPGQGGNPAALAQAVEELVRRNAQGADENGGTSKA